jgi:hypothetical protein
MYRWGTDENSKEITMAADSKVLAIETKAIREWIESIATETICIGHNRYRAVTPFNVTNARSGKKVPYRQWKNSCRPVPISDCGIGLSLIIIRDGVEKLQPSIHAITYQTRDEYTFQTKVR